MSLGLNEAAVKRWLQDQQAARQKVQEERVRFLLNLTSEDALRLYLALPQANTGRKDAPEPSPLLWVMRQALARYRRVKARKR